MGRAGVNGASSRTPVVAEAPRSIGDARKHGDARSTALPINARTPDRSTSGSIRGR